MNYKCFSRQWKVAALAIGVGAIAVGCATVDPLEQIAKDRLAQARAAHATAKANSIVESYSFKAFLDAEKTLHAAEQVNTRVYSPPSQGYTAWEKKLMFNDIARLAYMAERQSQTAVAIAEGVVVRNEIVQLGKEKAELQLQKSRIEQQLLQQDLDEKVAALARAKQQLSSAKNDAERARILADIQAKEASLARAQAMAKAREAETARDEAERARAAAESARAEEKRAKAEEERAKAEALDMAKEAGIAKAEAEVKAKEAEMAKTKEERARAEAEARAKEALRARIEEGKAKIEAQARAKEAERARAEQERARAEAEARAKEATMARMEQEKARAEAEARAKEAERARIEQEKARAEAEAKAKEAERARAELALLMTELSELKGQLTDRGIVLTIGDVLFAFDKYNLNASAQVSMDKIAAFLQERSNRKLLIEGHTDSIGTVDYNQSLSERRAASVKSALVERNIATERITTIGYSEKYPVASNNTETGRQQNRRVEVIILNEGVDPQTQFRK